jgi:hypothetical protein
MTLEGAVVREQGVTFAIVVVKEHVLASSVSADEVAASFAPLFPGLPIVLMAQNYRGVPTYRGRPDIARFLAGVSLSRIPWKKYSFA